MQKQDNVAAFTSAFILVAGISTVGILIERDFTSLLFLSYFSSFIAYYWFCRFASQLYYVLALGSLCRLILFFGLPTLSDDLYRFLWDGHLLDAGYSPFDHLPEYFLQSPTNVPGLTSELYHKLNSPEYFSVYPPFNQLFFWLCVQFGNSWLTSGNIIRSFLTVADIGSFFLLRKILAIRGMKTTWANWYFLNPLVILEITGNIHFEGMVIFFLLLGIYFLFQDRTTLTGIAFGMAVATKLLPLIYLPGIFFQKNLKKGYFICSVALLVALISFLPMIDGALISSIQASLGLYINKFEFNGSIYLLLRQLGYWITGYNIIGYLGPALAIVTTALIVFIASHARKKLWPVEQTLLLSLTIYLLLSTTVHPWYMLPLIPLGLLAGFYFPIVWSLMIFVTYFGYSNGGYELSGWWIVLEYTVVLTMFLYEWRLKAVHEDNS